MKHRFAVTFAAFALVAASSAQACNFSWKKGWSPDEIKQREDVRKVVGTFRIMEISGEHFTDAEGKEWIRNARYVGRLETARGTGWDTAHPLRIEDLTCVYYFKPEADAEGTFWISRRKVDGRYEILLWEGTYLPQTDTESDS